MKIFHVLIKTDKYCNLQTGFVETLKPQFTPGQVLMSPGVQTQRSQTTFIDPVEYEALKAQVKDLTEKLETVKS